MQCSVTPQMFWNFRSQTLEGKSAITGVPLPEKLEDCHPDVQADHYAQACYAFASYELARQSLFSISLGPESALTIVSIPSGVSAERAAEIRKAVIQQMFADHDISVTRTDTYKSAEIASDIGARVRALRRKHKLTLEDTAQAMVCTIPEASDMERGNRTPNGEQLARLEKLFGEQI